MRLRRKVRATKPEPHSPRAMAALFAAILEAKVREKQVAWDADMLAEATETASALRLFADTGDDSRLTELSRS